tara:strand:- start:218 stop:430 length:213 start_codon:yes stop_codon:yes gene_type:complete
MQHKNWFCSKCNNLEYEIGEIRVAGSFWQKIFNVQRSRFSSVTCTKCSYTEFFKQKKDSKITDIFDFFTT